MFHFCLCSFERNRSHQTMWQVEKCEAWQTWGELLLLSYDRWPWLAGRSSPDETDIFLERNKRSAVLIKETGGQAHRQVDRQETAAHFSRLWRCCWIQAALLWGWRSSWQALRHAKSANLSTLKGFKELQWAAHQFKPSTETGASAGIHLATSLATTRLSRTNIFSAISSLRLCLSLCTSAYLWFSLLQSRQKEEQRRKRGCWCQVLCCPECRWHTCTHTCTLLHTQLPRPGQAVETNKGG